MNFGHFFSVRFPLGKFKPLSFPQLRRNSNWRLERLNDRTILKIKGENCSEFLQGLITNDMNLLKNQLSIYAAFLNNKGRILYDSIIYKTDCENTFLLECDVACLPAIEKHLNLYKVRRKIVLSNNEYIVWAIFKPNIKEDIDFKVNLGDKCITCLDPRLSLLGYRAVVPQNVNLANNTKVNELFSYKLYRYKLGIAEGKDELTIGKSFPLEMNCDYLNGVSFDKGCYIGQEVTARTHHTGVVRKRLMPISFLSLPENINVDENIIDIGSSKPVGKLKAFCGNFGIGLMRVAETLASTSLKVGNFAATCRKPEWWPDLSEHYALKKHL